MVKIHFDPVLYEKDDFHFPARGSMKSNVRLLTLDDPSRRGDMVPIWSMYVCSEDGCPASAKRMPEVACKHLIEFYENAQDLHLRNAVNNAVVAPLRRFTVDSVTTSDDPVWRYRETLLFGAYFPHEDTACTPKSELVGPGRASRGELWLVRTSPANGPLNTLMKFFQNVDPRAVVGRSNAMSVDALRKLGFQYLVEMFYDGLYCKHPAHLANGGHGGLDPATGFKRSARRGDHRSLSLLEDIAWIKCTDYCRTCNFRKDTPIGLSEF